MSRRTGFTIAAIITAAGAAFLCLDILDIAEDFRIHFLSNIQLAIIIAVPAIIAVLLAMRSYVSNGSRSILWLGCGASASAAGIILKGWLDENSLNVSITVFEICLLLAALLHLAGACLSLKHKNTPKKIATYKRGTIIGLYVNVLAVIALITVLAYNGVFPSFYIPGSSPTLIRSAFTVTTIILFFISSVIYFILYRKRRTAYPYRYSLGLILFTLGLFFLSQGAIESRLYWLGEVSLCAGGIYLSAAAAVARFTVKSK